jgi:PAS domain S-box-containing protein
MEMLGYGPDEYLGRNIADFHADRHAIDDILARLTRGEKLDKYPARLVAKDGSLRHVVITSSVQFRDGRFINTRCFTMDITGWKQAEEALRDRDQLLAATYENAGVGISQTDGAGRLLRVNDAMCRITGFNRDELLQRSFFDLTHSDDLAKDNALFQTQYQGHLDHYQIEKRYLRKDGSPVWICVNSTVVRDGAGNIRCAVWVVQDINKQKLTEAALQDSERQFRQLLETLPAAIYTTDSRGRITFFNKAAEEMAGRRPVIGVDQWCVTWKLYWPDGTPLPHDQCPMAVALKENRAVRGTEAVAERPDGTRIPFIPFPTPLRDAEGNLIGAVNMLVDVSERKQAEANQKVLLNELNHRVKNNMQMLSGLIRAGLRESTNEEARAILTDVGQRIGAMAAAQQVLYGSGGSIGFNAEQFLETVCRAAGQSLGRRIHLKVVEAANETLSNDAAMPLALILNELLTNAAKYACNGRGECEVRVGLLRKSDALVLYVEDDGKGFELGEVRQRASGLGLVVGLARQLGGELHVQRNPKSRCIVEFPDHHVVH